MNRPGPEDSVLGGLARRALRISDVLTDVGLWLSMTALALIMLAFNYEVVARYFFGAPTRWSAEFVSYFLLVAAFMAMPSLTREGGHVAVTVLLERLAPPRQILAGRAVALLGAGICLALAWIAAEETARQFSRGVRIMAAIPVPKGAVSIWIVLGMGLSAVQFLFLALPGSDRTRNGTMT